MVELPISTKRGDFAVPLAFTSLLGVILSLAVIFTDNSKIVYGAIGLAVFIYLMIMAANWFFNLSRNIEIDSDAGVVNKVTVYKKEKVVEKITDTSEVEYIACTGMKCASKIKSWWAYYLVMILKNGQVIKLTKPVANKKHSEIAAKAVKLANEIGCKAFPGVHGMTLQIDVSNEGIALSNRDWAALDAFKCQGADILLAFSFFVAILLFIWGIFFVVL